MHYYCKACAHYYGYGSAPTAPVIALHLAVTCRVNQGTATAIAGA